MDGINKTGQICPPHHSRSYEKPQAKRDQKPATFRQNFLEAMKKTDRIIDASTRPRELAQELVNYMITKYNLPQPQFSSAVPDPGNPRNPDHWDWDVWESQHYTASKESFYEKDNLDYHEKACLVQKHFKIHDELGTTGPLFELCKSAEALKPFGAGRIANCATYLQIAELHRQRLIPITSLIRECIVLGLFSRDFIDGVLFARQ